jgi:poly(ADP-ribose) glycohydrolase ARH3
VNRSRYRGVMLGVVIGDAFGAPFEGHVGLVDPDDVKRVVCASTPLRYTDDTAMTIALGESLVRCGGIDDNDLARSYAAQWALGPERGYSGTTAAVLGAVHAGASWQELVAAPGRASNGAAMRVAPVALYAASSPEAVIDLAMRSARITHTHPSAQLYAAVHATAVDVALSHPATTPVDPGQFIAAVTSRAGDSESERRLRRAALLAGGASADEIAATLGTGLLAAESVPAAICAFLRHPRSFADAIRFAVGLGGDTDTIAAMTGAISGALLGEAAIPGRWVSRVEGTGQLRGLADRLYGTR